MQARQVAGRYPPGEPPGIVRALPGLAPLGSTLVDCGASILPSGFSCAGMAFCLLSRGLAASHQMVTVY